jgi:hypothetical protein
MKHTSALLITSLWLLFGATLKGQLAPDFTATALNGNSYNLYNTLNTGKTVILVFFSTQGESSKIYHESHSLKSLYTSHGPGAQGDNKVEIMYIEGDASTPTNCLSGTCGGVNMNWTSGISFPVFEDAGIAASFGVTTFPAVFIICPDKKVQSVPALGANSLWARARECPVTYGWQNVGIYYFNPGTPYDEICGTTTLKPSFKIVNVGALPVTNALIKLRWNGNSMDSIHWTGVLNTYEEAEMEMKEVITDDPGTISISVSLPGGNDENLTDNMRSKSFTAAKIFTDSIIKVKIRTDEYGFETYWDVKDRWGNIVKFGGNTNVGSNGGGVIIDQNNISEAACDGQTTYGWNLHITSSGCYSFNLVDAFGDGFLCTAQAEDCGYYQLFNSSNLFTPVVSGSEFQDYRRHLFGVNAPGLPSSTNDGQITVLPVRKVYPNPAQSAIHIEFENKTTQDVAMEIYSASGQLMLTQSPRQFSAGIQTLTAPVEGWSDGIYHIVISGTEGIQTGTFVKKGQ